MEVRHLQANIPQDLYDPLPYTYTSVLWKNKMGTKIAQYRQEEIQFSNALSTAKWLQLLICSFGGR